MPTADTYARFYTHPSLIEGKPGSSSAVYDDKLYIEIFVKGSQNTSFSRPKKDEDEQTYAAEWKAYQSNEDYAGSGTSLAALPTIGPSAQMNLNSQGIHTVEDLAELSDAVVIGERGMIELRNRARAYLEAANPEIAKQREIRENAQQATIEELQRQVKELQAGGAQIPEKTKRTRRKRNEHGELVA